MPDRESVPDPIPVLLLFGPTASGKTEVLERLFSSSGAAVPAEVVSADSMQVYRGMDIGTAKPDRDLLSRLPHHLIDIRDIREQFNVGDFVRLADEACIDIVRRGRLPVISGGTAFYFRNFLLGLPETPPSDEGVRRELKRRLAEEGPEPLYAELAAADPESAARIHRNDHYRILRALEVLAVTGRPLSDFSPSKAAEGGDGELPAARAGGTARPRYRPLTLGLRRPRDELYRRIDRRAARMFAGGLAAELDRLVAAGYGPEDPGMRAIGYREFFDEDGRRIGDDAAVEALVARDSRRYAKRQILFFSSLPGIRWIDADGKTAPADAVRDALESFLQVCPGSAGP